MKNRHSIAIIVAFALMVVMIMIVTSFMSPLPQSSGDAAQSKVEAKGSEQDLAVPTIAECPENAINNEEEQVNKYCDLKPTKDDVELIAKIVYLEARGESLEGQQGVVEVIFNRVLDARFPNTIEGVVYQKGQFSTVGALVGARPNDTQYQAIYNVLDGKTVVEDAIFFATFPQTNNIVKQIGNHYFCK